MIVDLPTLRLYLKVDADTTEDDPLIVAMEQAAERYLEHETGHYFGPVDELTEVLHSYGWGPVFLRSPVLDEAVYPPVVERRDSTAGAWAVVAPGGYEIDGARLYPRAWWEPAQRSVRVTYVGGYADGETPEDVVHAVEELVARMYEYRLPTVEGAVLTNLPASAHDVIRAYKIPVF